MDVEAVREQLRLLGHAVGDDVIESFIKGLRSGQHDGGMAGKEPCTGYMMASLCIGTGAAGAQRVHGPRVRRAAAVAGGDGV